LEAGSESSGDGDLERWCSSEDRSSKNTDEAGMGARDTHDGHDLTLQSCTISVYPA
jgi:hypothetical protein